MDPSNIDLLYYVINTVLGRISIFIYQNRNLKNFLVKYIFSTFLLRSISLKRHSWIDYAHEQ